MDEPVGRDADIEEKFSLPLFLFTVGASLAALVAMVWLCAPTGVWLAQVSATGGAFLGAFLAISMLNCFVEYVFHRYVLHKPVVPILSQFYRQHTLHHSLTRIGKRYTAAGREVPFVENIYPMTEPEQGEASFFPWYTLLIFAVLVTPLLAALQWLAPAFPWFFGGYIALASSIMLYEIFHAIEHWSFEKWAPLIEHARFGWFWRKVYSFHLRHHAVIDCNEAISGFFTLPVADWLLGTYILPKTLYTDGEEWKATEFTSPRPCALIRWCDVKSDDIVKARRARAQAPAAAYTRGERIAHYFTHGTGLVAGVAALVLLGTFAALRGDTRHVVTAIIFGLSLLPLYATFTNYHRARVKATRLLFRSYNHAAIFLLIAGTATPFLLSGVRGPWGWSLAGAVWALCLVGAVAQFVRPLRTLSTVAYCGLGFLTLVALKPLLASVPAGALWLLAAGILCYVVGTLFHVWQRISYHFVVRHVFAIGGTTCHLLAVLLFVLPRGV
jgi:hemolysin III